MLLEPSTVTNLTAYCLFKDGESTDDAVMVEGITRNFGFHPGRLAEKKPEIVELLNELPEPFQHDKGGGWSFLQACVDRHGNQWTGQHSIMEDLFCLGIAIGKVQYCLPRETWSLLPGGVPYLMIGKSEE